MPPITVESRTIAKVGFSPQLANTRVKAIRLDGGSASGLEVDLGDHSAVVRIFDGCESELGPADILIINHTHAVLETFDPASVTNASPEVVLTNAESIDRHFAVNSRASALMMAEYLRRHLQRAASWGRIIGLTTTAGHGRHVSYAASKNALVSYCFSAAAEMGKYGITVNAVRPGATQTGYITPESEELIVAETPLRRLGEPEDVADVIVFLASEQGRWITGQLIPVGGGFH